MKNFLVCPLRDNSKVSVDVCIMKCELKSECDEFQNMPHDDLHAAMRRLKIPVPKEIDPIIEAEVVESQEKEKPNGKNDVPNIVNGEKTIQNAEAMCLYDQIVLIKTEIEVRFFEMGRVLDEIFDKQYYRYYGYSDRKSFCESAIGMSERTAVYLRNIYVKMTELEIRQEECAQIGWSKLKEVLPIIDKRNARKWISKAKDEGMTTEALNTEVRLAMGKITKEEAEKRPAKMIFSLYDGQFENVERALELARGMTGSESRGHNLDMVCADFRGTYEASEGSQTKAEVATNLIERIETVLRVRVNEIIDADTEERIRG